jgi:hypothetical protein
MKISTTLLSGVALLGMTGFASAQTKIYVTGSTAFRASAINEITNLLNANGGFTGEASDNATYTSADAVTFTGGNISGTPVTIKTSWSGSGSGIQTVAGAPNFTVGFLPDGAAGTANADPRTSTNPHESAVPDICLSDVFQGTTQFNGTYNGVAYAKLTNNIVGVVAFTFAGSKNFPVNESMTPQIAQTLYVGGLVPLSQFTGNSSDINTGVIATGRDDDSGTRLTTMAETNVGVNTTLTQYMPTVSGTTITNLTPYPAKTINGVNHPAGDGGESSGGTLRGYLPDTLSTASYQNIDNTLTGAYLVTYLGVSDFNTVQPSGAVALAYTGVLESQVEIEQGSYTFWGYEHLDYKSTITGIKATFATKLASQITNSTSATLSPNVAVADMEVQRSGDGSTVSSLVH